MIIGITGLMGSGKSLVGSFIFKTFGVCVYDCDSIAHRLYECADVVNEVEKIVGTHRNPDNSFSRSSLLKYLLKNPSEIRHVNNIMHPLIIKKITEYAIVNKAKNQHYIVLAPLLFECKMENLFDKTIYIYTDHNLRIQRLKNSRELDEKIIKFFDIQQFPAKNKFSMCDHVVLNNGHQSELESEIYKLFMKIL